MVIIYLVRFFLNIRRCLCDELLKGNLGYIGKMLFGSQCKARD